MASNGIASTALDFLAGVAPYDRIWDVGSIAAFVDDIQALAARKREERESFGLNQAMEALHAEVAMLSDGELGIDLGAIGDADLSSLDVLGWVSGIEALTEAIASYRHELPKASDGTARSIADRLAVHQAIGAALQRIEERHQQLLTLLAQDHAYPGPVATAEVPGAHQKIYATPVPSEMWAVAYFLARYGRKAGEESSGTPDELGGGSWEATCRLFYDALTDGRSVDRFQTRMRNCRSFYDAHVPSGRQGFKGKIPQRAEAVMEYWKDRPRDELWDYVKQFITR